MLTGTAHFTILELARDTEWPIPPQFQDNAQATLEAAEVFRANLGGGRLQVTSLWRSVAGNAAQPDAATDSRHLTAQAIDLVPLDLTVEDCARRWAVLVALGAVPSFDQAIFESDHIHFDPGGAYGARGQSLVSVNAADTAFAPLSSWIAQHPVSASAAGVALVIGFPLVAGEARRLGVAP